LQQLQSEYGEDDLVVLYYHVSGTYGTADASARGAYYDVSGIPEADFDAVSEVIGAGSSVINTYRPIVQTRLAASTPITMSTTGIIRPAADPDSSWVTTTFRVVDTVPGTYGALRAQFVVYEDIGSNYPWTVRDVLPPSTITTLSAPGDSVVVTKKFVVNGAWNAQELHVAVFLEDTDPKLIVNAQLMPDPYNNAFTNTDSYAQEISYFGEAVYHTTLTNTGVMGDTIAVSVENEILPDGLGPFDWPVFFCDSSGTCYFNPTEFYLEPGETEVLDIHVIDGVGTTEGMALTAVTAESKSDPMAVSTESFATFVELPSILLVDDDNGQSHETYLKTAVEDAGYAARVLDTSADGRPVQAMLGSYWAVLWTTANGDATYLDSDDEQNMAAYLDGGGNLMLASMEFLSSRVETGRLIPDYLHIGSWTDNNGGFVMTGVGGDEVSDGMSLTIIGGPFAVNNTDAFTVGSPAEVVFTSPPGNKGLKVAENDHKVVFLSFPFECVKTTTADPDNQLTLITRILDWFDSASGVEDSEIHRLALAQNYPNPFNPVTRIAFSVPDAAGRVTLDVHDVSGRLVKTLVDEEMPAGPALAVWDGTDSDGARLPSGVYFARLSAGEASTFRKMTLLK
jgi:hypothetical protein